MNKINTIIALATTEEIRQDILRFRETKYKQYHVHYIFHMPNLMTQKGTISHNSGDLTNIEKLPQDFLFNKKYNGSTWLKKMNFIERKLYPYDTITNLNSDDCLITRLVSEKLTGKQTLMEIIITGM